jgi:hypothetical protein
MSFFDLRPVGEEWERRPETKADWRSWATVKPIDLEEEMSKEVCCDESLTQSRCCVP